MADYPVLFNTERPEKFDRAQLVLRILVLFIVSAVFSLLGWVIFLVFPVMAAVFISQKGSEGYLRDDGQKVVGWITWLMAIYAYIGFLIDKAPTENPESLVRYEVQTGGTPTVGSALLRLILVIPSAFVLGILGFIGAIIWVIAFIMILIQEQYSEGLYNFQLGIMRWQGRLLAYLASLVDPYPPFALDQGPETTMSGPEPSAPAPQS